MDSRDEDEPLTLSSILQASQSPLDMEKQKSLFASLFNSHSRNPRRPKPKPLPSTVSAVSVIQSTGINKNKVKRAACNDDVTVKRLLGLAKGGDLCREFSKLSIEVLVKKLWKIGDLDELEKAIRTGSALTNCVTIPRPADGRLRVSNQKVFPHVVYCRLWRWPDLTSIRELYSLGCCKFGYSSSKEKDVCVNPYHYERVETTFLPSSPQTSNSTGSAISSNSNARSSLEELIDTPFNYSSVDTFSPSVGESRNYEPLGTVELVTADPLEECDEEQMVTLKSEFHVSVEILNLQNEYADVHLIGQDGFVPVHGLVLKYFSPFVDALIGPEGENSTEVKKIILPDFTATSIQKVVKLIYSGETTIDSAPEAALILDFLNILNIDHTNFSYYSPTSVDEDTTVSNETPLRHEENMDGMNEGVEIENTSFQLNSDVITPNSQSDWGEPSNIEDEDEANIEYLQPLFQLNEYESPLESQDRLARENASNNMKINSEIASITTTVAGSTMSHLNRFMDAVVELSSSSSTDESSDEITSSSKSMSNNRKRKSLESASDSHNITNLQNNEEVNRHRLSPRARRFPAPILLRRSMRQPVSASTCDKSGRNKNVATRKCSPTNPSQSDSECIPKPYVPINPRPTRIETINSDTNLTHRDCSGDILRANLELFRETAITCQMCSLKYPSTSEATDCIRNHNWERCNFCMQLFENPHILHRHFADSHRSRCPLCDDPISRKQGTKHALICVDALLFPSGRKRQPDVEIICTDPESLICSENVDQQSEVVGGNSVLVEAVDTEVEVDPNLILLEPPSSLKQEFEATEVFSYENAEVWN